jgi:tetratricopeptide (TPR) repeat protein
MKKTPGKRLLLYIIFSLVILFLLFFIYFTYQRILDKKRQVSLSTVLSEVDQLMSRGFLTESREVLDSLVPRQGNNSFQATSYLRLLKRYHLYSRQTGNWEPYIQLARQGMEKYPGRIDFAALAVHGMLRAGAWEAAADLTGHLEDSPFVSLKAELLMRSGGWQQADPADLGPQGAVYFTSDPELLIAAGDVTGLIPYYLDAALLYMGKGDFNAARAVQRKYLQDDYPLFAFYLTMDLQEWEKALGSWDRLLPLFTDSDTLLKGDILLRLKRLQAARQFYSTHLTSAADPSWLAYYNLAWLQEGREKENTLLKGLSRFPEEEQLNLAYVRYLIYENRDEEALSLLETMIPRQRLGLKGELILLRLLSASRSGAYLQGRYWELMNKYPQEPEAAQALIHYALGWGQQQDAETALSRAEKNLGSQPWIVHWRGINASLGNNPEEAERYFKAALDSNPQTQIYYNYSVLLGSLTRYEEALSLLETAVRKCDESDPVLGNILIRMGAFNFQLKRFDKAKEYILKGLSLAPRNLEGLFILKSLEDV